LFRKLNIEDFAIQPDNTGYWQSKLKPLVSLGCKKTKKNYMKGEQKKRFYMEGEQKTILH